MTFPKEILPDLSVVGRDWTRQRNAVLSHTQTQSLFFFISMSFFMYYNPWVLAKLSSQKCTYGFSCSVNGSLLLQQKAELVMLISCFSRELSSGRSQRGLVSLKHGLKKNKTKPKTLTRDVTGADVSRRCGNIQTGRGGYAQEIPTVMTNLVVSSPGATSMRGNSIPEFLVSQWDHLWLNKRGKGEGWWSRCCAGILRFRAGQQIESSKINHFHSGYSLTKQLYV